MNAPVLGGDPLHYERVVDSVWWGAHGVPHAELADLRANHPVWRYEGGEVDSFWLITRHADVTWVSRHPELFSSAPRTILDNRRGEPQPLRSIVQMDPPEHGKYRRVVQAWMTPRNLRTMESTMRSLASDLVDEMAAAQRGDLVAGIATRHPLRLICQILGVPPEGEAEVLALTKALFGSRDPDFATEVDIAAAHAQMLEYCQGLAAARREVPGTDLASVLAMAQIDGEPIGMRELVSHLLVIMSAGHDTTAAAIGGGLLALVERPDQLAKLQNDTSLIPSAIEEILRWTTPTTNFVRTATEDTEIGGVAIPAGDDVCLSFAAANRDPAVFDAPEEFRLERSPNPHLAFGIGTHVCVGLLLARMEIRALFETLIPRIRSIELDGPVERIQTIWIAALKRLPARYDIAPA